MRTILSLLAIALFFSAILIQPSQANVCVQLFSTEYSGAKVIKLDDSIEIQNDNYSLFFQKHFEKILANLGKTDEAIAELLRIVGIQTTHIRKFDSSGKSFLDSNLFEKTITAIARLRNAEISENQAPQVIKELGLNAADTAWNSGLLVLTIRKSSEPSSGTYVSEKSEPGITDILNGKYPGYTATEITKPTSMSRTQAWSSRDFITAKYLVVKMDPKSLATAREQLGETLAEESLAVLKTESIADKSLNDWIKLILKSGFSNFRDHENPADTTEFDRTILNGYYVNTTSRIAYRLRQFLFHRHLLNLSPNVTYRAKQYYDTRLYSDSDPTTIEQRGKILPTKSFFENDKPYTRRNLDNGAIELFGHLEASATPSLERTEAAVTSYLNNIYGDLMRSYKLTQIVITTEGQFSAVLMPADISH
jgi:hypothetical protein